MYGLIQRWVGSLVFMCVIRGGNMGRFFNVFTGPIYISLNIAICQILMFWSNANFWEIFIYLFFFPNVLIGAVLRVAFRFGRYARFFLRPFVKKD